MSAIEVIEQIKKLSPDERAKVVAFIREQPQTVRYADDASFSAAKDWALKEHSDLLRKLAQ